MRMTVAFLLTAFCIASIATAQTDSAFKPNGKVWGLMFGDYFYRANGDNPGYSAKGQYVNISENFHAFQLRRLYLGYDYNATPSMKVRALLEVNDKSIIATGGYVPFVKQAYLEWKNPADIGTSTVLNIGLIPVPLFTNIEKAWGWRSVGKTIIDYRGIMTTADFGASLSGSFDAGNDTYGYSLMIGNGTGVKAPDFTRAKFASREKEFYLLTYALLLDKKLTVDAFLDYRDGETDPVTGAHIERKMLHGFASYTIPKILTISVEGGLINNINAALRRVSADTAVKTVISADIKETFFSIYATATLGFISDKLEMLARYDLFNNDANFDPLNVYATALVTDNNYYRNYKEGMILIGLAYRPASNISFIPNVEINSYTKHKGGVVPERTNDITPRITFYYVLK
ncbi:hypothetical protein MASR2M18_08140 [Ignavibacteria bacterium]|nr:hypothetical protein [Bacteroidota bacterium]MCZ2132945.1 hypothetical protein [Bacteroidota bacterium]